MKKWTRRAFISAGVLTSGAAIFGVAIRPGNRAGKVKDIIGKKGDTLMSIWLKIAPDNNITAYVPHAEMGQGVHTTLAMMLADELDADWNKLKIEEAPANKEYASGGLIRGFIGGGKEYSEIMQDTMNGIFNTIGKVMNMELTGGSASVRFTGRYTMRVAGAAAKEMIKQAAAKEWNVPIEELTTHNSIVSHSKTLKTEPYAHFAPSAAELKLPVQPKLKEMADYKIMGTDIPRIDIPAKINGTAQYGIDVKIPNMKYAAIKASPVFGNKLKSVDESGLQKRNGLQKVVKLENAVTVIAEGYWQANKALGELKIEFENTENNSQNTDNIYIKHSLALDSKDNLEKELESGDVETVFKNSKTIIEQTYKVPFLAHAAMEPMNCTVWLQKDKCEVWLGCQNPLGVQKAVAEIVYLDQSQVFVYNQYLGGGFGRKSETDIAEQAAKIAKEVPFPVKLIWSREEDVQQDKYRDGSISKFKAALNDAGNIEAWQNVYSYKNEPKEASIPHYKIDNQFIAYYKPEKYVPWGNWRSVDHSKHGFFIEGFVDELAHAAKKDPLEYRISQIKDNPRLKKVLETIGEKANWKTPLPKGSGRGISIVESFGTIVAQVAEVTVTEDGVLKVNKVTCVADPGFAVHPDGFKAQMESGIIFGLTAALYGEINIENGAVKESNFHDYQMVRMNDAPEIETHIINGGGWPGGAGEPSTPGIAPAVCNAIFAATGIRIRELPIKNVDLSIGKWVG